MAEARCASNSRSRAPSTAWHAVAAYRHRYGAPMAADRRGDSGAAAGNAEEEMRLG